LRSRQPWGQGFLNDQSAAEFTQILQDWNGGIENAKARLILFVYEGLKRHARGLISATSSRGL